MKIGILGGSFDPPHFGHLLVARQTKEAMGLDEIWLMPYFAHSWDETVSNAKHRLAMAKRIEEHGILVSEEEIGNEAKSYTIDTVRRLGKRHTHDFFWIVGSDVLPEFSRWKEYQSLTNEITLLVFPRNGYAVPTELPAGFLKVASQDLVTSNISSTIVRHRLQNGLSVVGLIPESVLSYVQQHGLYAKK